jgi:hypothetical protein
VSTAEVVGIVLLVAVLYIPVCFLVGVVFVDWFREHIAP